MKIKQDFFQKYQVYLEDRRQAWESGIYGTGRVPKILLKDRLKLLLVSDRAGCSSEVMELMKNDIISVISKYMEIDEEELDIQITKDESRRTIGERSRHGGKYSNP